ncbi:MAG: biopolymer transporter ExbD [Candidatus Marinimicrobia bacterium]|nr:biopolymer transporter ExbD [Candidatus Neomarinimicrobiota bacterium]
MRFKAKHKAETEIPTASLPDIIFMLLLFFMVSSVLRQYEGLNVVLPSAKQIEKLETKRHVSYIWISKGGLISIDGKLVEIKSIRNIMYEKRVSDPQLIVSIRADKQVKMGLIAQVHNELREADALKVNYSSKTAL